MRRLAGELAARQAQAELAPGEVAAAAAALGALGRFWPAEGMVALLVAVRASLGVLDGCQLWALQQGLQLLAPQWRSLAVAASAGGLEQNIEAGTHRAALQQEGQEELEPQSAGGEPAAGDHASAASGLQWLLDAAPGSLTAGKLLPRPAWDAAAAARAATAGTTSSGGNGSLTNAAGPDGAAAAVSAESPLALLVERLQQEVSISLAVLPAQQLPLNAAPSHRLPLQRSQLPLPPHVRSHPDQEHQRMLDRQLLHAKLAHMQQELTTADAAQLGDMYASLVRLLAVHRYQMPARLKQVPDSFLRTFQAAAWANLESMDGPQLALLLRAATRLGLPIGGGLSCEVATRMESSFLAAPPRRLAAWLGRLAALGLRQRFNAWEALLRRLLIEVLPGMAAEDAARCLHPLVRLSCGPWPGKQGAEEEDARAALQPLFASLERQLAAEAARRSSSGGSSAAGQPPPPQQQQQQAWRGSFAPAARSGVLSAQAQLLLWEALAQLRAPPPPRLSRRLQWRAVWDMQHLNAPALLRLGAALLALRLPLRDVQGEWGWQWLLLLIKLEPQIDGAQVCVPLGSAVGRVCAKLCWPVATNWQRRAGSTAQPSSMHNSLP